MEVHRVEMHDGVLFKPGGTPIRTDDLVTHGGESFTVPPSYREESHAGRLIRTWAIPTTGGYVALSQVLEPS